MQDTKKLRRHADLVDRMANALGLDLELMTMEGKLRIDTIGDAVMRCTGCSDPTACNHWLTVQDSPVDTTPDMCRNADLFDLLKAGKRA